MSTRIVSSADKKTTYPAESKFQLQPPCTKGMGHPDQNTEQEQAVSERKSVFSLWCELTTWHGVLDWYKSESCTTKFFWALLILICFGLAGFQFTELLLDFINPPHYTTSTYMVDNGYAEFPNITLCNFNRANLDRIKSLNMGADQLNYLYAAFPNLYDMGLIHELRDNHSAALAKVKSWEESWNEWTMRENISNHDIKNWVRYLSFWCHEMLVYCMWAGHMFDCCDSAHAKEVFNQYGRCWSISPPVEANKHRPLQRSPGALDGLKIFINPGHNTTYFDAVTTNFLEEGIVLGINYDPYQYIVYKPIAVSPGTHMWVSMSPMLSFVGDPYLTQIFPVKCIQHPQLKSLKGVNKFLVNWLWRLYDYVLAPYVLALAAYSRRSCKLDCHYILIHDTCNCSVVSETKLDAPSCNASQMFGCILKIAANEGYHQKLNACVAECGDPCARALHVDTAVSTARYPAAGFVPHIMNRLVEMDKDRIPEQAMMRMIVVDIFFDTTMQLVMEINEKVPIYTLIANIGGVLGLWLGASIVTLFQALYYLLKGAYRCGVRKKILAID